MKNFMKNFDVEQFILDEDTLNVFDFARLNKKDEYQYIKILIKQAYLQGSIDTLNEQIDANKD